jgi:hypothetical protein
MAGRRSSDDATDDLDEHRQRRRGPDHGSVEHLQSDPVKETQAAVMGLSLVCAATWGRIGA